MTGRAAALAINPGVDRGASVTWRLAAKAGAVKEPGLFWTADRVPSVVWILPTRGSAERLSRRVKRALSPQKLLFSRVMPFDRYLVEKILHS